MKMNSKFTPMIKLRAKYSGENSTAEKIKLVHGRTYDIIVSRVYDDFDVYIRVTVVQASKIGYINYSDTKYLGEDWGRIAKEANDTLLGMEIDDDE